MVTVSGNPPLSSFLQWVQPVSTEERNQEYLQSCRNEMGRSWVIHHSLIDHTTTRIGPLQQGLRLPNIICPARIRGHIQLRQRDIYILIPRPIIMTAKVSAGSNRRGKQSYSSRSPWVNKYPLAGLFFRCDWYIILVLHVKDKIRTGSAETVPIWELGLGSRDGRCWWTK